VPTTRHHVSEAHCPITRAADVLGDRWTLLILKNANVGMTRFDEFAADLGIADNILSARLSRLVRLGLLTKVPYLDGRRQRFEYKLTGAGADVLPILRSMADWGHKHTTTSAKPAGPITFLHAVCGTPMQSGEYCPACRTRVPRHQEVWVRPWRDPEVATLAQPVDGPGKQLVFAANGARRAKSKP
jgi:DNA-binding HxlR family transcriptional regulator